MVERELHLSDEAGYTMTRARNCSVCFIWPSEQFLILPETLITVAYGVHSLV